MLNDLVKLYGTSEALSTLTFDHYWIRASQVLKLPAIRVVSSHDYPRDDHRNYIGYFLDENRVAAMFPLSFFRIFTGFGFRSLSGKAYSLVKRYSFSCYTASTAMEEWNAGRVKWGVPFLLSEDAMSAEVLGALYPFSFAYMRSAVSENLCQLIALFTKKVILVPDRDEAGEKGFRRSKRTFDLLDIGVHKVEVPPKYNDAGDIFKAALQGVDVREDLNTVRHLVEAVL